MLEGLMRFISLMVCSHIHYFAKLNFSLAKQYLLNMQWLAGYATESWMESWEKCYSCVSVIINPEWLANFLITVDQMERMESCYLCEVLHFLLRERYGIPLVKLSIDLVDVENEAALDLLYTLFKHCECYERIVMHIQIIPYDPMPALCHNT